MTRNYGRSKWEETIANLTNTIVNDDADDNVDSSNNVVDSNNNVGDSNNNFIDSNNNIVGSNKDSLQTNINRNCASIINLSRNRTLDDGRNLTQSTNETNGRMHDCSKLDDGNVEQTEMQKIINNYKKAGKGECRNQVNKSCWDELDLCVADVRTGKSQHSV